MFNEMPIAGCRLPILASLLFAVVAAAQESPAPTLSPALEESPWVSPTPGESHSPSAALPRRVRISFLPPPLEGTISLGIYDGNGTLVRVLHQQAELSE